MTKTIYKLNELMAELKKWQDEGYEQISIDFDEIGKREIQITSGGPKPMKVLRLKGTVMR